MAADFQDLAGTGITTVAELGAAAAAVTSAIGRTKFFHSLAVHLPGSGAAFIDHSRTCARLHACVERLPPSWVVEAMAGNLPPATAFAALALPRLGWRFPGGPVQIQGLSVRAATWAQLGRVGEQRQHRHARFVSHVLVVSNCPAPSSERDQAAVLKHLLSQLWKLPWHNQHKEVYWRLTLDALPTAARLHHVDPCICGEPGPNWFHHFWSCPVAAGLLAVLSNHLESRGMLPTLLLPLHVLLAQPPSSRLHVGIWRVVCLAAICALDHARRTACAIALAGVPSQAASAPASELTMLNRAVTRFWDMLTDFCALNNTPLSWQHSVAVAHPFIAWCDSWKVVRSLP